MFIRIAWHKSPGPVAELKSLRRLGTIPRRPSDDLGVPARDFARMTKGLFDRPE